MRNNKSNSVSFVRLFPLMAFIYLVMPLAYAGAQTTSDGPYKKAYLLSALESMQSLKSKRKSAAWYVAMIKEHKVDFQLTAEDARKIRLHGRYLGSKGLDEIIAAVRDNYRPGVAKQQTPTPNSTQMKTQAPSPSERGEPTEEEMKEAMERTMQDQGGQRRADGSIGVDNPIAGGGVKIVNFEKLGCTLASYGAGYDCTCRVTTSLSMQSNDGTEAGAKVAEIWGKLYGEKISTMTKRFVRSKEGWIMAN